MNVNIIYLLKKRQDYDLFSRMHCYLRLKGGVSLIVRTVEKKIEIISIANHAINR